jgi:phosphoserine aminotransferase
MLLFSAWKNRYTTATESNRRTAKTAVLRNWCITGKGEFIMARVYNFSAGPSMLPEKVLRQAITLINGQKF